MGYFVEYNVDICIPNHQQSKALDLINQLHSSDAVQEFALGGRGGWSRDGQPIPLERFYPGVTPPQGRFQSLEQAFMCWHIVDNPELESTGSHLHIKGKYHEKWLQQDLLLQQLAPVLEDTRVHVIGEDGEEFDWIIENHKFLRRD